jgi:ABC-type dipeptide/oligopeptide/nickel transport system permease component
MMLRHALRRVLWTLPTLIGVSIISFFFLSYVPDPTDDPTLVGTLSADELATVRRERFLDLPRFLNLSPRDVRVRAREAVRSIVEGGPMADAAARDLARLGGAALPHVLPTLDTMAPEPRIRVALALAPVANRMGLPLREEAIDPARAVGFWTRFWDDRGVEFRGASVRSAVRRLARYGSGTRAAEILELDTFALEHVLGALSAPRDEASIEHARALVEIAAHVTGSTDRIGPGDALDKARACVERWQKFWAVYSSDFVTMSGPSRIAAMVVETRYGKWALGAVTQRFGVGADGRPVLDELVRRARTTLLVVFGAIALAYAVAVPLGALSAASRGRKTDLLIACTVLGLYAVPTAVLAVVFARTGGGAVARLMTAIGVLALALVAAPTRQLRSALATAIGQEYFRAALARGASRLRGIFVHALRNALLPIVTLAALEAPMALGGAFVVERVFGLDGLGEATIRAVQVRDIAWLMALSIFAAAAAAFGVIVTDLAYVVIDRRVAPAVFHRRGAA